MIRVDRVGLTTVQDEGRRGYAHLGVPRSGAADLGSYRLANRLAGNDSRAAVLETSGGLVATALRDVTIVLTGADCEATVDVRPLSRCRATTMQAGESLRVERIRGGTRAYVSVAGGIVGIEGPTGDHRLLGSLSHDTLGGFTPVSLHDGVVLGLGVPLDPPSSLDLAVDYDRSRPLAMSEGPHQEMFTVEFIRWVVSTTWSVSATSNRVGIRLVAVRATNDAATTSSSDLASSRGVVLGELDSIPLVRGAVQVTPSNELVVMLADHPTTGGYPVIGVVTARDVDRLSQFVADTAVTFAWSD
jgi:biotin-dependent carboxylase-like uncharacterized protein